MRKFYFLLALLTLALSACKNCKPGPVNNLFVPSDEAEITSLAINTTIPSDTFFKKHFCENGYWERKKYEKKVLENIVDTATIYVFISDTLKEFYAPYIQYFLRFTPKNDKNYPVIKDWAAEIILKKKPDVNEKPAIFQMKNLRFEYGYKYALSSQVKLYPKKLVVASGIAMSPVYFNKKKTKAFVYIERYGGLIMSIRYNMYFEKRNGKWVVVLNDFLGVE
ncbi:hypothetical protein SAMN05216464_110263 [Mucilaginibacter pineti]|uniref:Lipoprotein n=1 Tax=Mucilaginibacter pineti TaxID=1391627 RepID=A0A1G7GRL2_9SPHI|nr:hypothetical protein [Mucilaginibacter pineti]SDE90777.1 hypothetical protein SAMN05216464_110263 [Mucilaginibacter pineti]